MATDRCFYFGCWNRPGHYLHAPGGTSVRDDRPIAYFGGGRHVDSTLAPRRMRRTGELCATAQAADADASNRMHYASEELEQGKFLRHELSNGFTAISWWDCNQGDGRPNCNSTVFLEGKHTSEEMLAALQEHFPHVLANLERAGVQLVEVFADGD